MLDELQKCFYSQDSVDTIEHIVELVGQSLETEKGSFAAEGQGVF